MLDGRISAAGALVAALGSAASWLCCLPIALGALGTGTAAAATLLGPLRPYISLVSLLLLGCALFQAYRPNRAKSCGTAGECARSRSPRRRQLLWIATSVVVVLLTLPHWASWVIYWTL